MKLIKPSFEIYEQGPGLEGIYEAIERAGRTCYKSKRPEGQTAKDFVDRMIASQHYAMLEHGTVYLDIPFKFTYPIPYVAGKYENNPYSKTIFPDYNDGLTHGLISTNYRVLVENGWLDDLQYLCEPTELHEKRVTVRFTTDRGVSHEFVRHRVFSFAQESTRYCNYSKDKFGNEIQCIIPSWSDNMIEGNSYDWELVQDYNLRQTEELSEPETRLIMSWCYDEAHYIMLLNKGILTAQQARQVLPNALKTELVMTGFISDWQHFFDLRAKGTTGAPHPDAKALAEPLMEEFETRKLI